jgi:hypothetical protein
LLTTGSSFRETMEEYFAAVHELAGQVTHAGDGARASR